MPDKAMSLNLVIGASLAGGFHGVFRTAKGALGDLNKTAANLQIGDKLKSLRAEQRKQAATAKQQGLRRPAMPLLGAAYAVGRLAGQTMEVEEQRIHLRNVIQPTAGDKDEALARSAAHARAAARTSLASESELLELQYQLSSGGLDEEKARVGSVIAANVAKVTRGSSEQAAQVMTQVENTLGGGMERIGDVLTQTQFRFSISDFGQLGEGMTEAASGALAAKLPLEQTAMAIGMLNTAGQTGGAAGASLNAVLRQLGKASDELGFAMVRGADGSLDLGATLQALDDRLPEATDIDARNEAIQRLFDDEGKAGLVPLLQNLGAWRENLDAVDQSTGTVAEAIERFKASSGGQWTMLTQNIQAVGTAIAGTLLPRVNSLLEPAAAVAGWVGNLVERFPLLGQVIGLAAVSIGGVAAGVLSVALATTAWATVMGGPFGGALTAMGGALKTVGAGMLGLVKHLTASNIAAVASAAKIKIVTAAQWLWNAALNANPIGLVVAAVAALAAGVFVVYKYWEPISGFFGRLWDGIKSAFSTGWTWIVGSVGGVWEAFRGALGSVWESIRGWFGSLDMASLGRALIETLAKGIAFSPVGLICKALKSVLGSVGRLLPGSDAKEGPLSGLTAAGASIVGTVGAGVRRAGARGLQRPLTRTLGTAAAGLALTLPPPPAFGGAAELPEAAPGFRGEASRPAAFDEHGGTIVHAQQYGGVYIRELTIHQQPGEDPHKLADRVIEEIEERMSEARRDALYDID